MIHSAGCSYRLPTRYSNTLWSCPLLSSISFPGADQGTGRSGNHDPSAGGSDGSAGTAGPHLPLIPPGAAFWAGPPPPWGPAGPPRNPGKSPVKGIREYFFSDSVPLENSGNPEGGRADLLRSASSQSQSLGSGTFSSPCRQAGIISGPGLWPQAHPLPSASSTGQDHSSQGSQCHLPELPTAAPRKGAFPAACSGAHPLCQVDPTRHSCPGQHLSIAHTEQAPKQDFWIVGDQLQCLSQNYWLWTSKQAARIQSQDSWSAVPNLHIVRPNPWTPEWDTRTLKWNSRTLSWALTQGPRNPGYSSGNFRHGLPATLPPAWRFSFPSPSSPWTIHTLLSFAHLTHPHGPAPISASWPLSHHIQLF